MSFANRYQGLPSALRLRSGMLVATLVWSFQWETSGMKYSPASTARSFPASESKQDEKLETPFYQSMGVASAPLLREWLRVSSAREILPAQ